MFEDFARRRADGSSPDLQSVIGLSLSHGQSSRSTEIPPIHGQVLLVHGLNIRKVPLL
jgi:hypothetical protein